jgi:cell division protein FtsW
MTSRLPLLSRVPAAVVMPRLNRPDPWLLVATAILAGLGLVMVFNASYFYAQERFGDPFLFVRKHVAALMIGTVALTVMSRLRVQSFDKYALRIMLVCVVSLLAVLAVGVVRNNALSWFYLGPFNLQPAEFAKIGVVLYLARAISRYRDQMENFRTGVLPHLVVVGLCAALIAVQPDVGTAIVLLAVLMLMLFVGGARLSHLAALGVAALPVLAVAVAIAPYRLNRIRALLDPWEYRLDIAFQLVQSMVAFGSGGLFGVGLGESQQKMLFLPEAHTDFIFSVIGEELGLAGAALVLGLFVVIGLRGFRIAMRHPDPFASMLALGITVVILLEAAVNVGVAVGLLPTTGLALPFLSYGGSALVRVMIQIGILAALSRVTG